MAINLTGTWQTVYAELNGQLARVAHYSLIRKTFIRNTFKIEVDGVLEHEGTYSINDKVSPSQITFVYKKSSFFELGKRRVGIVQLTGDTLKMCVGAVGAKAPSSFNTERESDAVLTVQQRKGAEKGVISNVSLSRNVVIW